MIIFKLQMWAPECTLVQNWAFAQACQLACSFRLLDCLWGACNFRRETNLPTCPLKFSNDNSYHEKQRLAQAQDANQVSCLVGLHQFYSKKIRMNHTDEQNDLSVPYVCLRIGYFIPMTIAGWSPCCRTQHLVDGKLQVIWKTVHHQRSTNYIIQSKLIAVGDPKNSQHLS